MNKPKYAVIPENMECVIGLTQGKKYEITEVSGRFEIVGWGFYINLDFGENIYCLENDCAHLSGADWELIYE
jgi:hypothetical protein